MKYLTRLVRFFGSRSLRMSATIHPASRVLSELIARTFAAKLFSSLNNSSDLMAQNSRDSMIVSCRASSRGSISVTLTKAVGEERICWRRFLLMMEGGAVGPLRRRELVEE